jgi:nickel/cobalt exporter
MEQGGVALLAMAFGLGSLHALDADHIAAVSGLACRKESGRYRVLRFALQWASGHGLMLMLIGGAVLLLGAAIPVALSHWAESLVGVVLVVIGVGVLRDLHRQRLHLQFHHHEGLPGHAHWQHPHPTSSGAVATGSPRHTHRPLLVGVIHGTAGSAPLLALLPLTVQQSPWVGMGYLLVFGFGVFVAMSLFGGLLGWLMRRLLRHTQRAVNGLWLLVGGGSTVYGGWLLYGAI